MLLDVVRTPNQVSSSHTTPVNLRGAELRTDVRCLARLAVVPKSHQRQNDSRHQNVCAHMKRTNASEQEPAIPGNKAAAMSV